jgi:hypothetical protein
MFKSLEYNLSIVNTTLGVNVNKLLYPSDQEYRIRVPLASQLAVNNTLSQMGNTSLPIYQLSATTYNLSVIYQDMSGLTTNLKFNCSFRNGTFIYGKNLGNPGTGVVSDNCTVTDSTMGDEIIWWYNATRSGT